MEAVATFVKFVTTSESRSNDLILPHAFSVQFRSRIPRGVKFVVRNGYSVWLDYNKVAGCFEGIRSFFQLLNITGGETLVVQHSGDFEFKVSVFNVNGCEIKYPTMPNAALPNDVSGDTNGWSFVKHLSWGREVCDSIDVPYEFLDVLGIHIPSRISFIVSSGHEIDGSFSERRLTLEGLQNICNMLDVPYLNGLNALLFTFDGVSRFVVRAFADSLLETPIAPTESAIGETSRADRIAFQFEVQGSHMLQYEHGVDIPVEYRKLCKMWSKTDNITAYVGMRCWKLEIRHRSDRKRTTINAGWINFRTDLQIEEGDICVFEWKNATIRNFNVQIVKAGAGAGFA